MMKDSILAGKIINTHGIKGEVKAEVYLDSVAFLKSCGRIVLDGRVFKIVSAKDFKNYAYIKLEGIDDIDTAVTLKEKEFYVNRKDAKLKKGQIFLQDIIGLDAVDENGNEIGTVSDVMENPAHPVLIVKGETEHLVPAIPEFIMSTNLEDNRIVLRMLEGM